MATTPTWQAASSGSLPLTGQVNQLLGTHQSQILYPALRKANQSTAGAGNQQSNGTYIAQSFTTAVGQTTVGYVVLTISTTGGLTGLLPPTALSLHANNAGAPALAALQTTTIASEYVATGPAASIFPLPVTGLTASTTYWLVLNASGDSTHHFNWSKSNQVSGCSTSANGTTWAAQAFGLLYEVWDQTISATTPILTWQDNGARWSSLTYNADNTVASIAEYTAGQTSTGYVQSYRNLAYTNKSLTAVT
jgi:hypothetical protein